MKLLKVFEKLLSGIKFFILLVLSIIFMIPIIVILAILAINETIERASYLEKHKLKENLKDQLPEEDRED